MSAADGVFWVFWHNLRDERGVVHGAHSYQRTQCGGAPPPPTKLRATSEPVTCRAPGCHRCRCAQPRPTVVRGKDGLFHCTRCYAPIMGAT